MMWFDESFDINEDVREELSQVALIVKLSTGLSILGIYIGFSLLASSVVFLSLKYIKKKLTYSIMLLAPVNGLPSFCEGQNSILELDDILVEKTDSVSSKS